MSDPKLLREALSRPLPADKVKWRPGSFTGDGKKCSMLAYIDARDVMDRLDDVFGVAGWGDAYEFVTGGGVVCTLTIRVDDRAIIKTGVAEATDIEAFKGGASDALKRAAVKLGIGRYLYRLDSPWVEISDARGGQFTQYLKKKGGGAGWVAVPALPRWALPSLGRGKPDPKPSLGRGVELAIQNQGLTMRAIDVVRNRKDKPRLETVGHDEQWAFVEFLFDEKNAWLMLEVTAQVEAERDDG